MTTASETHAALRLLAAEFERSKQEQIERFLRDQEELNTKFSEFTSRSGDGDKEAERQSSDDSDTASVFTQHMALYKSRPQTAAGWANGMDGNNSRNPGNSGKEEGVDHEAEEWRRAVETATRLSGEDSQYNRDDSQQKQQRDVVTGIGRSGQTGQRLLNRRSKFPPKKTIQSQQATEPVTTETPGSDPRLLARRTTRPRTSTGLRSRTKTSDPQQLGGAGTEGSLPRNRPHRSSAPAALTRGSQGQGESSSYLPDAQPQNGFINRQVQPSYAASSKQMPLTIRTNEVNKMRSPVKTKQDSLDSSNCMIISSMSTHAKTNQGVENGRISAQLHLRKEYGNKKFSSLDTGTEDTVKQKRLAQVRLPSVSREEHRNQKPHRSPTQTDKTARKRPEYHLSNR